MAANPDWNDFEHYGSFRNSSSSSFYLCVGVCVYLQFDINPHILTGTRMVEQMEDRGDESFIDAAQLTVDHTLQDGAEASPFGHHLWVLQG